MSIIEKLNTLYNTTFTEERQLILFRNYYGKIVIYKSSEEKPKRILDLSGVENDKFNLDVSESGFNDNMLILRTSLPSILKDEVKKDDIIIPGEFIIKSLLSRYKNDLELEDLDLNPEIVYQVL